MVMRIRIEKVIIGFIRNKRKKPRHIHTFISECIGNHEENVLREREREIL